MSSFYAKAGQFWLDGKPQLIQAGEFHYFRTPQDQWAHRLSLLKNAGLNALATYIPWLWHQLDEDISDFNGHSHPMRDLEGFLDLVAEMGFYIIPRPGPYIMAETTNEGIPPWVFTKYPQVAFVSQDKKVQNVVSYMHPDFLKCVKKWYKAIFGVLTPRQITHGGKIILIQLDNEMGMIQWVRNILDTNPDTISRLVRYLKDQYGGQLINRYPADDLEEFITDGILNPNERYAGRIVDDYRHFYRQYLCEYASFLWAEAKSNGMDVAPVVNIHGFMNGGKTFPIGISQLIKVMELDGMISATDVYPGAISEANFHQLLMLNEMTKVLQNKDQPLFSIEFQAGGNNDFGNGQSSLHDLHSRLCISSGMRAINHYLFSDGENDPILSPVKRHDWGHPVRKDGTLRSHYYRYPKLARVLHSYGSDLIVSQLKTVTTIGFMLDNFMTEVNNEFSKASSNIITQQREVILFDMIARGLSLTHRPFNTVDLDRCELDVSMTPTCWVMMEKQCNADVQQKLVDYIINGGKLILAGRICTKDFQNQECTILRDAIGIQQINEDHPFTQNSIHAFKYRDIPILFMETYTGEFDEVFATTDAGEIVGFIKTMGKGKVILFGAAMPVNALDDLDVVDRIAKKMDCPSLFNLSHWADVRLSQGANGSFLFINNYEDDPVETAIEYENGMMLDGNTVHVPARQGLILPIEWKIMEGMILHYITSEITSVNDDGLQISLETAQKDYYAELTMSGYRCDQSTLVEETDGKQRVRLHGSEGVIVLRKLS